ncbi:MAG: RluA family pseudouridine synthase [Oscillospiraceae bacterium]|nr:RluA family pseudouridine synthase [Oscillospiraceae bacterium]
MKSFTAGKNEEGVRLLRFCEKVCPTMPKSMLHKAFRNKRVKINGKKQSADYKLVPGDLIELYINDEFFSEKESPVKTADYSKLNILYEDANVLIVVKPFGLLCHSDNKNEDNLIDMVISYLIDKGEYSPVKDTSFTPALCNRIDQGTEGIVIAAKNHPALADINEAIRNNSTEKIYICITSYSVKDGIYKAYLKRDKTAKKVTVTERNIPDSKEIITGFRTIESKGNHNLVECTLYTGRTHQIRAHLAFIGSSILGDRKYGKPFPETESQLLCAYKLRFGLLDEKLSVAYLSGKEFCYENNHVKKFFDKL